MVVWLGIVLSLLAFLLPEREEGFGVFTSLTLNILLGVLTAFYFLTILPMTVLPMGEEDRFHWFLFTGFGWMAVLLGSITFLGYRELLTMEPPPLPTPFWIFQGIVAAVFLLPLLLCLAPGFEGGRRLWSAVLLLVGWAAVQGGNLAYFFFRGVLSAEAAPTATNVGALWLVILAAAILLAILATAPILPSSSRTRGELSGLLLLLWLFAVAGVVCLEVYRRRMKLAGEADWETFLCLFAAAYAAPILCWLGMPWAKGERLSWGVCLAVSAAVVLSCAALSPFEASSNVFEHVWRTYDGPHLIRWSSSF